MGSVPALPRSGRRYTVTCTGNKLKSSQLTLTAHSNNNLFKTITVFFFTKGISQFNWFNACERNAFKRIQHGNSTSIASAPHMKITGVSGATEYIRQLMAKND